MLRARILLSSLRAIRLPTFRRRRAFLAVTTNHCIHAMVCGFCAHGSSVPSSRQLYRTISARLETALSDGSSLGERVQQSAEEESIRGYGNRQRVQLSRDTQCQQLLRREGTTVGGGREYGNRPSERVLQESAKGERAQQSAKGEGESTTIG